METIKKITLEEVATIYDLFITPYFPENEVKPLVNIVNMMKEGLYSVYVMYDEETPMAAAFLTTYPGGNTYLLDYLSVSKSERSKGLGSKMITAIKSCTNGMPVLIETESLESAKTEAETSQRIKRNAFYERAGAKMTDVTTLIFGAEYNNWVLESDKEITTADNNLNCSNTQERTNIDMVKELTGIYKFMVNREAMYNENVFIPFDRH